MDTLPKLDRSLKPLAAAIPVQSVDRAGIGAVMAGENYRALAAFFDSYPERSLMLPHSRAVLYTLARMLRPTAIAEIGTLHAGTSEVLTRALWENGSGTLFTTDPYGADRCPSIIAAWPIELQRITEFHALNSMDFLQMLERRRIALDLVLVDGNHDYEFALFDLQMTSRLMRPGGIVVMDNAEQTGPFQASRTFLAANPAWQEIGDAIARYDDGNPFDASLASLPGTTFIVLAAPSYVSIGPTPRSSGVVPARDAFVSGLTFDLQAQRTTGRLHYRVFTRAFADDNRWIGELAKSGDIRIEVDGDAKSIVHHFDAPLTFDVPTRFTEVVYNVEVDLSWQPDHGAPHLALARMAAPVGK